MSVAEKAPIYRERYATHDQAREYLRVYGGSNAVQILPNPAAGLVVVHTPFAGDLHVTVSNPLGETVMEPLDPQSSGFTLDISGLAAGTYYLTITSSGSVVTRTIVRE